MSIFSFTAGMIIDSFSAAGNTRGAFITLSVAILVISVLHLLTLVLSKEKPKETEEKKQTPFGSVGELLGSKIYILLLILSVLEAFASGIITPFLGTYEVGELGFSMTFISIIGVVFSIASIIFLAFFGRISKMVQHKTMLAIAYPIITLAYFINGFTAPENGTVLFIVYSLINRLGAAALSVSTTNVLLECVPRSQQTAALAIRSIATGILSFFITLAVSPFIEFMQSRGNQIFGITIYAQQILSFASSVIYAIILLYYFLILYKNLGGTHNRLHNSDAAARSEAKD